MSAPRNALGRGLGALLPSAEQRPHAGRDAVPPGAAPASELRSDQQPRIRVDQIDPNPDQPRRVFDPARLEDLARSIARSGLLQPVVVRRAGDRYELIVGERRWRASQRAGLATIPAVVADVAPAERLELAIVENVQRHDLNPIELASAYRALAERGATQEDIGQRVGKDRSSIANHLRLLDLSVDIQEAVEAGSLSMGHAKALLQVGEPERRQALCERVLRDGLSVRETEKAGREIAGPSPVTRKRKPRTTRSEAVASSNPHLRSLQDLLQQHFQSRVRILGSGESGRLEIEYGSGEDLDRITRLILEGI
jgi:ParB family chromosome partitioning protein